VPIDKDTLSSLIESIYECVLDRSQWTLTLERLAGVFHACNAIIFSQGVRELSFGFDWGVPAEAKIAYAEKYAAMDPMRTMDWHFEVDYPITLARFIGSQEFRKTKFYCEYVAPLGWIDFLTVILEKSSTQVTTFGFSRDVTRGPFGEQEAELIRLLAPHVRRATNFMTSSTMPRHAL